MEKLTLTMNQQGYNFYKKWQKDTKQALFIYSPGFLIVILGLELLACGGFTLRFLFASIFPIALVAIAFIYSSYFLRKRIMNYTIENLSFFDNVVFIKTFKWFSANPISLSSNLDNISVTEIFDQPMYKGRAVLALNFTAQNKTFFLVEDFFNNIESFKIHPLV